MLRFFLRIFHIQSTADFQLFFYFIYVYALSNALLDTYIFLTTFFSPFISVAAASQGSGKQEPMFISRSETFKFVAGETIHLPCEVSNAGRLSE